MKESYLAAVPPSGIRQEFRRHIAGREKAIRILLSCPVRQCDISAQVIRRLRLHSGDLDVHAGFAFRNHRG